MANGLYCSEALPSTPKLRHVSTDSNSENTPPELLSVSKGCDLVCTEVLDYSRVELPQPQQQHYSKLAPPPHLRHPVESFHHAPVESKLDPYLLGDDRVLQNLLRNEERYMPASPDYFTHVQREIRPHMRFTVTEWMFEICMDERLQFSSSPEVFALAVNFLDRFLSLCCIRTSQFQLLGTACLFLASKFKAVEHLNSDVLVSYTDNLITSAELKEWELLVLQKLRWELSSVTPLDYLDHVIPRLQLRAAAADTKQLRQMVETVICYAAQHYAFASTPPSLLAAAAILYSLQQLTRAEQPETRTCLQILTHAGGEALDTSLRLLAASLPAHLTRRPAGAQSPDSTSQQQPPMVTSTPAKQPPVAASLSPEVSSSTAAVSPPPSLHHHHHPHHQPQIEVMSAVDVFSDFNSSVLEAVLSPNDSFSSILVS